MNANDALKLNHRACRVPQFVKWEVYREGERVADGLSFTVYRTGRSPSAKATCVGEATTFRERLFP